MDNIPLWKKLEMEAAKINCLPAENGMYKWKCETCGIEWLEIEDIDYDRTKDHSNWPVQCRECLNAARKT